jgi:hypothetical protein
MAASTEEGTPPEDSEAALHGQATTAGFGYIEELEIIVNICSSLDPKELGRLACVSASFKRRTAWRGAVTEEVRSVVEETARRWVSMQPVEEQARATALWPGWLRRMREIQVPFAAVLLVEGAGSAECNGYYAKRAEVPLTGSVHVDDSARRNLTGHQVYCKVGPGERPEIVSDIRWNASRSAWMICTTKGVRSNNRYISHARTLGAESATWQVFSAYDAGFPGVDPAPRVAWLRPSAGV